MTSLSPTPYQQLAAAEVFPELRKHMLIDGFDIVLDLDNSGNGYYADALTGKRYLDLFSCFASVPLAMNHPKLNNDDFIRYIGKIALQKPSNSDLYTQAMADFVKTFFAIALPDYFRYSFYIEGGALANENAMKVAFDWKVRKNFRKGYTSERGHKIMHFQQAFHGRSGYTMSLTNTDPNKVALFPKFDYPRIHNPRMSFPQTDAMRAALIKEEDVALNQMKTAFMQHRDEIAAMILEPIQGEGGDNHFRPEFLQQIRNLCDENEALLIFDEVQTGVGITGTWWAHEQLGVQPDLMTFGKKMQVCGLVSTGRVDDIEDNVFHKSSRINSTWGGNLVDMVRATQYLRIIQEEQLVQNAATQGSYVQQELGKLAEQFPSVMSNVRGRGLFCAFDLPNAQTRTEFLKAAFANGLLILGCGERSIRFRPPLDISSQHIDEGMTLIAKALRQISNT